MEIGIKWFDGKYPSFNIELSSSAGKDPFITIKSCSLREHNGKEFVSFPSKKMDSGKYWNHVYASDDFQRVIIEKAKESMPKQQKPKVETYEGGLRQPSGAFDDFDDLPF